MLTHTNERCTIICDAMSSNALSTVDLVMKIGWRRLVQTKVEHSATCALLVDEHVLSVIHRHWRQNAFQGMHADYKSEILHHLWHKSRSP